MLRTHTCTEVYNNTPLHKIFALHSDYSCSSCLCVPACVPPSLGIRCGFTLPSLSLLLSPFPPTFPSLCQSVSLCCLFLSLCFPSAPGRGSIRVTFMATQATAATNKQEGLMTEQPPERGVHLCLCVCWLIIYERVHRHREKEGVNVYVDLPKSRGDWQLGKLKKQQQQMKHWCDTLRKT